jgi:hypothetical protein
MTDWEDKLSPLAREKLAKVGELSPEEKERMKNEQRLKSLLAEFYKGQLDSEGLWWRLKEEGKPLLLKEAQINLIDSLGLGSSPTELQKRKDGILAIESLKEDQNTAVIQERLDSIRVLRNQYLSWKGEAARKLEEEIKRNPPQIKMQPVRTKDGRVVQQATVSMDEAIRSELTRSLSSGEKQYSQAFLQMIERLKQEVK